MQMPQYLFAYHGGGMAETPQEQQKVMAQWQAWYASMGNAVVQGGAPVGMSKIVSTKGVADDGGANPVSGYTVVRAENFEAATKMAGGCPTVISGKGSVEVAELIEL